MSEFFVSNSAYTPYSAAAVTGVSQPSPMSPAIEQEAMFVAEAESTSQSVVDWQPEESDLLPSLGVERARELLMWLINLELRLPPYTEVSPA